jgi:hypothetical protein
MEEAHLDTLLGNPNTHDDIHCDRVLVWYQTGQRRSNTGGPEYRVSPTDSFTETTCC